MYLFFLFMEMTDFAIGIWLCAAPVASLVLIGRHGLAPRDVAPPPRGSCWRLTLHAAALAAVGIAFFGFAEHLISEAARDPSALARHALRALHFTGLRQVVICAALFAVIAAPMLAARMASGQRARWGCGLTALASMLAAVSVPVLAPATWAARASMAATVLLLAIAVPLSVMRRPSSSRSVRDLDDTAAVFLAVTTVVLTLFVIVGYSE